PVQPAVQEAAPAAAAPAAASGRTETIDSPLVGTFYRAANPEAAPYVNVGDRVTPDTVVAIIEAMKVMNDIKAEKSGVIKEILVENGQPVEFSQPLFVIE
ncbi:MAG: acetyl-CoA carboxylase biotin carboxyl carrier protein, partial [Lentisphaeria bacterium]|nr:acetyl-CoA carboxylase biotin carboxyl carrier protein [Lentisphaeria bacterium]